MLKVIAINKKEYPSQKTGKIYVSYDVACLNEEKVRTFNIQLDSKAIDYAIEQNKIKNAGDLVGKLVQFARLEPVYLTDFEKQYGIKFDFIVAIK